MAITPEATTERRSDKRYPIHRATAAAVLLLTGCSTAPGSIDADPGVSASPAPSASAVGTEKPQTAIPQKGGHPAPVCDKLPYSSNEVNIRVEDTAVHISNTLFGKKPAIDKDGQYGRCANQIIFRFDGQLPKDEADLPGIHVAYVKPPIRENPSDRVVTGIKGDTFLEMTFGTWSYGKQGSEGPTSVQGSDKSFIEDLRLTQNNEGVTTWVAGMAGKHALQVLLNAGTEECPDLCYIVNLQGSSQDASK
jgi:hypothetical protein